MTCNSIDQSIVVAEYSRIMLNKFCEFINFFFFWISNRTLLIKKLLYAHDDEHIVT